MTDIKQQEYDTFLKNRDKLRKPDNNNKKFSKLHNLRHFKPTKTFWVTLVCRISYFMLFYVCLFAIMVGLLILVLQSIIQEDAPYLTGYQSLLSLSPGLSHRPNIDFRTSAIIYESSNPQSFMPYVQNIRTFIYLYEEVNIRPQDGFASCDNGVKSPDDPNLVCKFFPIVLSPCVKEGNYGYDRGEPCVILKMNKIFGWLPDIQNTTMSNDTLVSCHGRRDIDEEAFGHLFYYPNVTIEGVTYGYFSSVYFPYLVQVAYRQPLVAMQLKNVLRNNIFMITCSLLNLNQKTEPLQFEILVD